MANLVGITAVTVTIGTRSIQCQRVQGLPNVSEHIGVLGPRLGKAKVTQLEHWRIAVVQQGVIQLEVPAELDMSLVDCQELPVSKISWHDVVSVVI